MIQNLFKGAGYLIQGFRLMNQQGIRHFAYLPMLINIILFSLAIYIGYTQFDSWLNSLMPSWLPEWLMGFVRWLLMPLFTALISIIVFFSFSIIANLLASPFNGPLAEAVERKLTGQSAESLPWKEIISTLPAVLWNELKKIKYFILWMIPLFIFSWIPVINIVAPLLWLTFSAWMLTLEYHDYPLGNHNMLFSDQRELLSNQRGLVLGFGLATLGITMIPFVNFLVIPAAVSGATALYLDNLTDNADSRI